MNIKRVIIKITKDLIKLIIVQVFMIGVYAIITYSIEYPYNLIINIILGILSGYFYNKIFYYLKDKLWLR